MHAGVDTPQIRATQKIVHVYIHMEVYAVLIVQNYVILFYARVRRTFRTNRSNVTERIGARSDNTIQYVLVPYHMISYSSSSCVGMAHSCENAVTHISSKHC